MAHARTSKSSKGSLCCAAASCFPEVHRLQRSSSLSKRKVMNEQESEQGFPMMLMFTGASTDSQGWPQAIKHGPESCRGGRPKYFSIPFACEFPWGRASIVSTSWDLEASCYPLAAVCSGARCSVTRIPLVTSVRLGLSQNCSAFLVYLGLSNLYLLLLPKSSYCHRKVQYQKATKTLLCIRRGQVSLCY